MENLDLALVDWSRAQFALTAIYHWIFVPLTLGLSFIVTFMHTLYFKTNNEKWKSTTKFWMKIFGINFAIGVATGIILEFEFGTNWSNYSWFVGDIFGAPLAIEGILAFFMESTFIAVMFFGWGRVNKKFHMLSSWLVAFGSNISAIWILVANAWMQNPVGVIFNPDTARNEMVNFFDVLSPTAVSKFLHTVSQSYLLAAVFVIGVSAWFILKGRHEGFAKRSIIVAATFGLISSLMVAITGDSASADVAKTQPMKLAAMEGLYEGSRNADLVAIGMLNSDKNVTNDEDPYVFALKIPSMLSILAFKDADAFVPGIKDVVYGNEAEGIESTAIKIQRGKLAINALREYKEAKKANDEIKAQEALTIFKANYEDFGYGYFNAPEEIIPPVGLTFYSFHIMVGLGFYFIFFFIIVLYLTLKDKINNKKLLLRLAVWTIPLAYLASQLGWVVAEVGRQPWTIVGKLPVGVSTSHISVGNVQTTFWLFAILFTLLLIAEIKIMTRQIKIGPKE